MNFEEFLQKSNEKYKAKKKADPQLQDLDFNREILLNLHGVKCSLEELLDLVYFTLGIDTETLISDIDFKKLNVFLHEKYMVEINYNLATNTAMAKERFDVYIDFCKAQATSYRPDCFEENPLRFGILEDYRAIGDNLTWKDFI